MKNYIVMFVFHWQLKKILATLIIWVKSKQSFPKTILGICVVSLSFLYSICYIYIFN
jgi:hypothetical protein